MNNVPIIIPCYNMGRYLHRAIHSALAQQAANLAVEIIVVDDGSNDGAFDNPVVFPSQVKVLRQKNQGSSVARNTGLNVASGDFILFLDADDILPQGVLASQLNALAQHPEWDLSVCLSMQVQERTGATYFWPLRAEQLNIHLCHKNIAPPHAILMRKSAADAAKGFDPSLQACVDHDFWLRCARAGKNFGCNPHGLVIYWLHEGSISRNENKLAKHAALVCNRIEDFLHTEENFSWEDQSYAFLVGHSVNLHIKKKSVRMPFRRSPNAKKT